MLVAPGSSEAVVVDPGPLHEQHPDAVPRVAGAQATHTDLTDGDVVRAGSLEIRVVAPPGHTADSILFALPADHALLTRDTALGRGTTVVAQPDGEPAALGRRRRLGG